MWEPHLLLLERENVITLLLSAFRHGRLAWRHSLRKHTLAYFAKSWHHWKVWKALICISIYTVIRSVIFFSALSSDRRRLGWRFSCVGFLTAKCNEHMYTNKPGSFAYNHFYSSTAENKVDNIFGSILCYLEARRVSVYKGPCLFFSPSIFFLIVPD